MSQDKSLSPADRIGLVQNDRARRYGQIAIAIFLIAFSVGFISWYAIFKAEAAFLDYMAVGILALLFAGIGAAYAIFGLGRTVGSTNNSNNESIMTILRFINENSSQPKETTEAQNEFFEDNRDDDLESDQPTETPVARPGTEAIAASNVEPGKLSYLADRNTWNRESKTINGKQVVLVATQLSRRGKRKRTVYVYQVIGTNLILYNRSRYGIFFMRIAFRSENMQAFYDTFVSPPQTAQEIDWLERNDYVLV